MYKYNPWKNYIFKPWYLKTRPGVYPILGLIGFALTLYTCTVLYMIPTRPTVAYNPKSLRPPWERYINLRKPKLLKVFKMSDNCVPRNDLADFYEQMEECERKLCDEHGPLPGKRCPPKY